MRRLDVSGLSRERWLALRRQYIGGSDAPVIMEKSKFSTKFQLAHEKLGLIEPAKETDAMRWGNRLEPVIRVHASEDFKRETGGEIEVWNDNAMYIKDWQAANTDGRCRHRGQEGIFEVKVTDRAFSGDWKNGVPDYYKPQGYHYMDVLSAPFVLFCALVGRKTVFHFLWRDEKIIREQRAAEREFYDSVMVNKIIPDPSFNDFDFVKAYEGVDDSIVDLSAYNDSLSKILTLKQEIKTLQAEEKALQVPVRHALGKAKTGESDRFIVKNGRSFTIKEVV